MSLRNSRRGGSQKRGKGEDIEKSGEKDFLILAHTFTILT
jgi:hypothetical protein